MSTAEKHALDAPSSGVDAARPCARVAFAVGEAVAALAAGTGSPGVVIHTLLAQFNTHIDARRACLHSVDDDELPALVRGTVERAGLEGRGKIEILGEIPPVLADPTRIEQVLGNLLTNAVKYSSPGTPIRILVENNGEESRVLVHNRGARIPSEDMPRLFQRFSRLHKGPILGAGLGLYVCRGIVEAHGGRIWVDSDDEGTTFRFTLPRAEGSPRHGLEAPVPPVAAPRATV